MSTAGDIATALAPLGFALIDAGVRAAKGQSTKEQAAKETIDALLAAIPRDELVAYLTPEGVARGEFLADLIEKARFG